MCWNQFWIDSEYRRSSYFWLVPTFRFLKGMNETENKREGDLIIGIFFIKPDGVLFELIKLAEVRKCCLPSSYHSQSYIQKYFMCVLQEMSLFHRSYMQCRWFEKWGKFGYRSWWAVDETKTQLIPTQWGWSGRLVCIWYSSRGSRGGEENVPKESAVGFTYFSHTFQTTLFERIIIGWCTASLQNIYI